MPFDYDDPYVEIECHVRSFTDKAVKIIDTRDSELWVPRSLLHGGDDIRLKNLVGENAELKIRRWFCQKEGLI